MAAAVSRSAAIGAEGLVRAASASSGSARRKDAPATSDIASTDLRATRLAFPQPFCGFRDVSAIFAMKALPLFQLNNINGEGGTVSVALAEP
jgi:hypothetical protein